MTNNHKKPINYGINANWLLSQSNFEGGLPSWHKPHLMELNAFHNTHRTHCPTTCVYNMVIELYSWNIHSRLKVIRVLYNILFSLQHIQQTVPQLTAWYRRICCRPSLFTLSWMHLQCFYFCHHYTHLIHSTLLGDLKMFPLFDVVPRACVHTWTLAGTFAFFLILSRSSKIFIFCFSFSIIFYSRQVENCFSSFQKKSWFLVCIETRISIEYNLWPSVI